MSLALVGRARLVPVMIGAALLAASAFLLLGIETSIVVGSCRWGIGHLAKPAQVRQSDTLQRVTPTALLARVFAFKEGLTMAAWASARRSSLLSL